MFSGILTKILLGLLVGSLAFGGFIYVKYNYWDKPAYEKQIKELQEARLKLEITKESQERTISQLEKQKQVVVRVTSEKVENKQALSVSVDDLFRMYERYQLHEKGVGGANTNRRGTTTNK
jgi:hypothetical protein